MMNRKEQSGPWSASVQRTFTKPEDEDGQATSLIQPAKGASDVTFSADGGSKAPVPGAERQEESDTTRFSSCCEVQRDDLRAEERLVNHE